MSVLFPNVPMTLGVPPVLRDATNTTIAASTVLRASAYDNASSGDWGVFDRSGARILEPDNIVSVEFGGEFRISDYPTEAGGFQSYNKVAMPFEVRLTMTKGGSVTDRTAFLNALETLRASLDTVDIATPERVYVNVNLTHLGQARSASSGAGMAVVETVWQEVRETVAITYTKNDPVVAPASPSTVASGGATPPKASAPATPAKPSAMTVKNPWSAPVKNQGSVQPRPTPPQSNSGRVIRSADGHHITIFLTPATPLKANR